MFFESQDVVREGSSSAFKEENARFYLCCSCMRTQRVMSIGGGKPTEEKRVRKNWVIILALALVKVLRIWSSLSREDRISCTAHA